MNEEWTDWKTHDGKGVPSGIRVGVYAEAIFDVGGSWEGVVVLDRGDGGCWIWSNYGCNNIIRYRIRKPRALQAMIERAEALPVVKHLEVTE